MSIAALLVSCALALAQQATPRTGVPLVADLPVSIDRIREALDQPTNDRLSLRVIRPDFAVEILERERFDKLAPPWDFRSGPVPPGGLYAYELLQQARAAAPLPRGTPLVSIDLLPFVRGMAGAISRARSAHAADAARDEVQRAIAEYCTAQPNAGAGIQLCAISPAIR
jgi:hypothetical protein